MKDDRQSKRSDLFLVRVWVEDSNGGTVLRGKIQRAVSGEAHYFRNLPELEDVLRSMIPDRRLGKDAPQHRPVVATERDQVNTPVSLTDEEVANPARSK